MKHCSIYPTSQKMSLWKEKNLQNEHLCTQSSQRLSSTSSITFILATHSPTITYSLRNPDWLSLQDTITNAAPGKLTSILTLDSEIGNSSAGNCSGAVCKVTIHTESPQAAAANHPPLLFQIKYSTTNNDVGCSRFILIWSSVLLLLVFSVCPTWSE